MPCVEIVRKAAAALKKQISPSDLVHRLCLEAGIQIITVSDDTNITDCLQTLTTSTVLRNALIQRAENQIKSHKEIEGFCEMIFSMFDENGIADSKIIECLSNVASMCQLCIKDDELQGIIKLLSPTAISTPKDLFNLFILGPYSKYNLPPGWWKATTPLSTTTSMKAYVLKEYHGLIISYTTPESSRTRYYKLTSKNPSIKEVTTLVEKTKHILTEKQREYLCSRIRDGEWESVDVDESIIECDPQNPNWSSLKGDLKVCFLFSFIQ